MIDFNAQILGIDGEPAFDGDKPLTVGAVCIAALLHENPDSRETNFKEVEDKVKRALLAQRIIVERSIEMTSEQISDIKKRVGAVASPMAVLRVWEALDPSAVRALSS